MKNKTFFLYQKRSRAKSILLVLLGLSHMAGCVENSKSPVGLLPQSMAVEDSFLFTYPYESASSKDRLRAQRRILERIERAQKRIDLWCYGFDETGMAEALLRAKKRGVALRIIGSPEKDYTVLSRLGLSIERRRKSGIQHAKLILIDEEWLISGTGNFTRSGFFYNNNVFFIIPVLAAEAREVREALLSEGKTKKRVLLSAWNAEVLVSPNDGRTIQNRILSSILQAKHRLQFLVFSHSDPVITSALRLSASKGVLLEGIYNDNNNNGQIDLSTQKTISEAQILNQSLGLGLSRIYLEGNRRVFLKQDATGTLSLHGGKLHHKTLLVDATSVLTGSYNWSLSARDRNLEVFFHFVQAQVVGVFQKEFERIRKEALLLGRPPFPEEFAARPQIQYTKENEILCARGLLPARSHRVAVFSGRGACFQARLFELPENVSCGSARDLLKASAGLVVSRDYPFGSLSFQNSKLDFVPGPSLDKAKAILPSICKGSRLAVHPIRSFARPENVAWIAKPPRFAYTQIRLWTREGLSDWLPLVYRTNDVLEIPTSDPLGNGLAQNSYQGGDAIFFFRNTQAEELGLACLQSGTQLNANLEAFRRGLLHESGKFLPCQINN